MESRALPWAMAAALLCSSLPASVVSAEKIAPFDASGLAAVGDKIHYGSYGIFKVGEGVYQIADTESHQPDGILGALGVDMFLVCGADKCLLIDLGNNYIDGYAKDNLRPRPNAAEEFLAMLDGLTGKRQLEVALTHMHPDHDGMTGAFANRDVTLWVSKGEDVQGLKTQHGLDPSVYARFTCGEKSFDLGGGVVVETFLVRGHTLGGTVYILKNDPMIFTGDAFGSGGRNLRTAAAITYLAEDSKRFVDYITANFSPYERYVLKVHTGHSAPYARRGWDIGWLDWRYIQNMTRAANGIVEGQWLKEGEGSATPKSAAPEGGAQKMRVFAFGIAGLTVPLEAARDAAVAAKSYAEPGHLVVLRVDE